MVTPTIIFILTPNTKYIQAYDTMKITNAMILNQRPIKKMPLFKSNHTHSLVIVASN